MKRMNPVVGRVLVTALVVVGGGARLYAATTHQASHAPHIRIIHAAPLMPGDCVDHLTGILHKVDCSSSEAAGKVVGPDYSGQHPDRMSCSIGGAVVCTEPLDFHGMP
jgi:hypothetical protein